MEELKVLSSHEEEIWVHAFKLAAERNGLHAAGPIADDAVREFRKRSVRLSEIDTVKEGA